MTPELSRPILLDRLPEQLTVEATAPECQAVAARLQILEVRSLACRWTLVRRGRVVEASGMLQAEVVQACVVSLEPVEQHVTEAFKVRFVPAGTESDDEDPESIDELPYEGAAIDLGDATTEQLALALDPYPHAPGAALDPGNDAAEVHPFAALHRRP